MLRKAAGKCILPDGVVLTPLTRHADARGDLAEIFRQSWTDEFRPLQWNLVRSKPNTLRGFHVHPRHYDYLLMIEGVMQLALKDARSGSLTAGLTAVIELNAEEPAGISIPPGVGHGFYFQEKAIHVYSVSEYWSRDEEIGCRWDDPDLGMEWGTPGAALSPRDETAGTYRQMVEEYRVRTIDNAVLKEVGTARA